MSEIDDTAKARLLNEIDAAIGQFERDLYEAQVKDRLEEIRAAAAVTASVTAEERKAILRARDRGTDGLTDDEIVSLYTTALDAIRRVRAVVAG